MHCVQVLHTGLSVESVTAMEPTVNMAEFQLPPARFVTKRTRQPSPPTPALPLRNRFEALTDSDFSDDEIADNPKRKYRFNTDNSAPSTSQQAAQNDATATLKVPPLYVFDTDFTALIKSLKSLGLNAGFKLNFDNLRIKPNDSENFIKIAKYLQANKLQYYSYSLACHRPKKVVVKYLPANTPEELILESLQDSNINISNAKVFNLRNKANEKTSAFVIQIRKEELTKLYAIKTICSVDVTLEPFRNRRGIPQCHNCQRYGHSSALCYLNPRCVKCGHAHKTETCKKEPATAPTCTNCHGPHPASYRGCAFYKSVKAAQDKRKSQSAAHPRRTAPAAAPAFIPAPPPKFNAWQQRQSQPLPQSAPIKPPPVWHQRQQSQPLPQSAPAPPPPQREPMTAPQGQTSTLAQLLHEFDIPKIMSLLQTNLPRLQTATTKSQRLIIILEICTEILLD